MASRAAPLRPSAVAALGQKLRQPADNGIHRQGLERPREFGERLAQEPCQGWIVGHDIGHEGRGGTAQRGADRGRIDVEHAVGEAFVDSGVAVMRLVGMDHHDLTCAAGAESAAIVEGLRAGQGESDRIGFVTMQIVGVAAEARRQALQAGVGVVETDAVCRGPHRTNVQDFAANMPDIAAMIYDTKTALVLRRDLAGWQLANVAAFLAGGLAASHGHLKGEPYRDGEGRGYAALIREPVFVFGGTVEELRRTHQRALARDIVPAVYIEEMFKTTNDADNRAAFAAAAAGALNFVGIGVHGPRKTVDKVTNGLKFLA
jgi:hypothetical protein